MVNKLEDLNSPGFRLESPENIRLIAAYLRNLADSIEGNPKNTNAQMSTNISRPIRPWFVADQESPAGFLHDGDIEIKLHITLPRRVGERIEEEKDGQPN